VIIILMCFPHSSPSYVASSYHLSN